MTAPSKPAPGRLMADLTLRQRYELLRGQLDEVMQSFKTHWKELNDYISPRRGRFLVTDANRGDRRNKLILDNTATLAARTLSSGMMGGITSPARPWFRLTTPDQALAERAAVKEWLYETTARMRTVFIRSNLYNVLPTLYGDIGTFATGAMAVLEDDDTVIRCQSFPIGSFMLGLDEKLTVRVFMRDFQMSVRQLVERFGYEKCSQGVKDAWDRNSLETMFDVTHVVAPNYDYRGDANVLYSKDLAFKSCYFERGAHMTKEGAELVLEEKGFHEWPLMTPRWETTGEDVYGTNCPGMTALSDIKQLQVGEKRALQSIDKQVNPPLVGPTSLKGNRVSLLPGDVTYNDAEANKGGLRPIHESRLGIQDLESKQAQVRYRIDRAFFVDLFQMLQYSDDQRGKQPVTAEEIRVRQEEKMLMLGPVLEQLNQDLLDPLIDRTFAIMMRRGLLPPIPSDLEGQPLRVEYISIMAQAQKMVGLGALDRLANFVIPLAQVDPSVLDKFDRDEIIDQYAEMAGVPPSVIVPDEEVAGVRAARAKAAAQQQQVQTLSEAAKAGKTLSETNTDGKNALTDIAGPGGVQALLGAGGPQ